MIYQLTYISEPFPWITIEDINNILVVAKDFNSTNQITGCLIYSKRIFMQLLEGEQEIIDELYKRIEKDKRHFNVELRQTGHVEERIFSNWAMAYMGLQETTSSAEVNKIQQNLILFAEGASALEINLDKFWNEVHLVLRDVGYYPNNAHQEH